MTDLSTQWSTRDAATGTPLRFVTAASLFDGHDASINIVRRILQAAGAEVIHLGHNRSVEEYLKAGQFDRAAGEIRAWEREFPTEKTDGQVIYMYARYWAGRNLPDRSQVQPD